MNRLKVTVIKQILFCAGRLESHKCSDTVGVLKGEIGSVKEPPPKVESYKQLTPKNSSLLFTDAKEAIQMLDNCQGNIPFQALNISLTNYLHH